MILCIRSTAASTSGSREGKIWTASSTNRSIASLRSSSVTIIRTSFHIKTLDIQLLHRVSFHVEGYDIEREVSKGASEPADGERSPPRAVRCGAGSPPGRGASRARGTPPPAAATPPAHRRRGLTTERQDGAVER